MATSVKTSYYNHASLDKDEKIVQRPARRIDVTETNLVRVYEWIGATLAELKPKPLRIRLKTEKGIRVVNVGDSILKFGKGADSTYLVIKA